MRENRWVGSDMRDNAPFLQDGGVPCQLVGLTASGFLDCEGEFALAERCEGVAVSSLVQG